VEDSLEIRRRFTNGFDLLKFLEELCSRAAVLEGVMRTFEIQDTVGEVVRRRPDLSRVFEQAGIDYCCGGKKSLSDVCREKDLDPKTFLATLEESASQSERGLDENPAEMSLTELVNHIEQTHHAYLRSDLPRIARITEKVASVHGKRDVRLQQLRRTFRELSDELSSHMMKEEKILFPMVRRLEASAKTPIFHCGSLTNPVTQMELEHERAGSVLEEIRRLTEDYNPPAWACNTYLAMLDALAHLERDLHQHIHKENNILFPRALEMESQKQA